MPIRTRSMAIAIATGGREGTVPLVPKILSLWAKEGLDLTNSAFNKLHSKESKFEDKRDKYDLKEETFCKFAKHLIEKVIHMHATTDVLVTVGSTIKYMLKEYSTISMISLEALRNDRWPAVAGPFTTQSAMDKIISSWKLYP
mmetsp:Transcript_3831/g.5213  ORF Transcript_3831/g.5213 Transcript_3831/m.5213 type:complete len:143 (+) Transcript_3831:203-631(+)